MGRNIPVALQPKLDADATTATYIVKIEPVLPGYPVVGASMTNVNITYDDGEGELLYLASIGMQPSSLIQRSDLSVDNGEVQSLLPEYEDLISEESIRSGAYDYARFTIYLVDYEELSAGHVIVMHGTLGRIRTVGGLSFWEEVRGLSQQLKQSVCSRDSLACRARFGSQPPGTGGGAYEEREWCGFDLSTIIEFGTVTSVGIEPNRSFSYSGMAFSSSGPEDDYYALGMVKWTSGLNSGREYEIEGNSESGEFSLTFPMPFPAQVGDTFEYRRGCNKQARDTQRGCKHWFGAEWVQHFQGEPDIPLADASATATPGSTSGPGSGGASNVPLVE